jgi:hypothetical protein
MNRELIDICTKTGNFKAVGRYIKILSKSYQAN